VHELIAATPGLPQVGRAASGPQALELATEYDVGLPGRSGIGGGIITVAPGKGGLATFAPPLDEAGNSVRGQLAARFLSRALGLDIFMSRAADKRTGT
jgi:Glutaminase